MTELLTTRESSTEPGCRGRRQSMFQRSVEHPILTVAIIALVTRVIVASATFVLTDGYLVPDEQQYIDLARIVTNGGTADSWFPGRGQYFYEWTFAFTGLIRLLFEVFPESRLVGQLVAAVFGSVTAALTVRIALESLSRRAALAAGLLVALLPSQVFWSSMALRESEVWASLALVGLSVALAGRARGLQMLWPLTLAACGLLTLGFLRDQTLVAAAWAFAIAMSLLPGPQRLRRIVAALLITAVLPWIGGTGVAGWSLVQRAVPSLASTRTNLAINAESAFTATTIVGNTTTTAAATTATTVSVESNERTYTYLGRTYVAEESVGSSLSAFPRGFVATTVRPFPWEATPNLENLLARIENIIWYALYAVGIAGLVHSLRLPRLTLFPFVVTGIVIGIAAVSQGNLGTAFRHRGQVLWAVALLVGAFIDRRSAEHDERVATRRQVTA